MHARRDSDNSDGQRRRGVKKERPPSQMRRERERDRERQRERQTDRQTERDRERERHRERALDREHSCTVGHALKKMDIIGRYLMSDVFIY